jgi:hypothetical protein
MDLFFYYLIDFLKIHIIFYFPKFTQICIFFFNKTIWNFLLIDIVNVELFFLTFTCRYVHVYNFLDT